MTPHVATVAGQPIAVTVLEDRITLLRQGPRGRHIPPTGSAGYDDFCKWLVRELVTEMIVEHEMRSREVTELWQLVVAVTDGVVVTDDEVRGYYDRNPDLYHTGAGVIPYKEAVTPIRHDLLVDARVRAFDSWLEGRRQELAVLAPGYGHPADPSHGFPSHKH